MKHFVLEVKTEGREVYTVVAETEEDARMFFERGKLFMPDISEVTSAEVINVKEMT